MFEYLKKKKKTLKKCRVGSQGDKVGVKLEWLVGLFYGIDYGDDCKGYAL